MHRQAEVGPRIAWRDEVGRLAALLGAAGLAIAQPVLDAFGKSPETFIFRDAAGADLVVFALLVVAVPPLALWGAGLAVAWQAPRWRVLVHGGSVGLLVGLAAVQVVSSAARPVALFLAGVGALAAWVLTVRARGFRMWSQWLAGLPVLALGSFLLLSPSRDLVASQEFDAVAAQGGGTPVVLIVLDELPTASIITEAGTIDAVRFPNLARLAGQATWYRNHTTQAGYTTEAVPAIFTGQTPEGKAAPLFTDHPDNIFRLLADSHDLVVSEALTQLCPTSVCGDHPTKPGDAVADDASGAQMGALLHDAVDLWWERVTGADGGPAGNLDAFEEEIPVTSSPRVDVFGSRGSDRGGFQEAIEGEPERLTRFLEALEPANRPVAAVLHLVSPHFPWRRLPDGSTYGAPADGADLPINGGNGGVPWVQDFERQRHLLQASFTDALVGQILDRLEEVDLFDEAAVVVTSDHGVAFHGEEHRRRVTPNSLSEIMWAPLIVKAPGQTTPRVDDTNVQSVDILPTIADLIGIEIPWEVDGLAAGSEEQLARDDRKTFHDFYRDIDATPVDVTDIDGSAGFAAMLDMWFPPIGPGDDPLAALHPLSGFGELVGQPFEPTGEVPGSTFEVDGLEDMLRSFEVPLVLTGMVEGGRVDEDAVAAVADGRIVAVSPVVYRNIGDGPAFVLMLPLDGSAGLGEVRLALVRDGEILDGGEIVD